MDYFDDATLGLYSVTVSLLFEPTETVCLEDLRFTCFPSILLLLCKISAPVTISMKK